MQDLAQVQALQRSLEIAASALASGQVTTARMHAQRALQQNPELTLQPILLVLGEAQLKLVCILATV